MTDQMRRERQVMAGIVIGLGFAIVYSLFVAIAYFIRAGANLDGTGLTLLQLIAGYVFGGAAGGALVGWLLPYSHRRIGAVATGVVGALPVFLGVAAAMGDELYDPYGSAVIASITIGGGVGYVALYRRQSMPPK